MRLCMCAYNFNLQTFYEINMTILNIKKKKCIDNYIGFKYAYMALLKCRLPIKVCVNKLLNTARYNNISCKYNLVWCTLVGRQLLLLLVVDHSCTIKTVDGHNLV